MKAIRVHEYDRTPSLDDVPEPVVKGPFDVIVKVRGAGVCRTDLHIIEGQWQTKSGVALPYTIGHENAGTVTEIGSAVTNVAVGDSVILHPLATCGLCLACRRGGRRALHRLRVPRYRRRGRHGRISPHLRTKRRQARPRHSNRRMSRLSRTRASPHTTRHARPRSTSAPATTSS